MTTNDYVPFDTANLMKKHGFCTPSDIVYNEDGCLFNMLVEPFTNYKCYAPTIETALKWLREVHGLYADVFIVDYAPEPWAFSIHRLNDELEMVSVYRNSGDFFATFEDAANSVIKVCLEKFL